MHQPLRLPGATSAQSRRCPSTHAQPLSEKGPVCPEAEAVRPLLGKVPGECIRITNAAGETRWRCVSLLHLFAGWLGIYGPLPKSGKLLPRHTLLVGGLADGLSPAMRIFSQAG